MNDEPRITLPAFSHAEYKKAKFLLATQVAQMMGRKLEEDDWNRVYCAAKGILYRGWSNLSIDVNYRGLGVEQKLLRVSGLGTCPIKSVCGTTMMHPAATRSIRISDSALPASDVMREVFEQYAQLIALRSLQVLAEAPNAAQADMRTGWLLWEESLSEFLYFEEPLVAPDPDEYFAEWNITPPRGARKGSKSLWIYERETHKKRYSVTTSAGIKIQPYFDVPAPSDANLYYFRVQSEPIDSDTVQIWVSATTARAIRNILGDLDKESVSDAIVRSAKTTVVQEVSLVSEPALAVAIPITKRAFDLFRSVWEGVSDEHRAQLFLQTLRERL